MNTKNQTILSEFLKKFNSEFEIHEFHSEWKSFLSTLLEKEKTIAIQALMNSMLENAQSFRQEAIQFVENGTEKDRQTVINMLSDLREHPFFMHKEATKA